jgi:RND superfamily putative drug exporter
MIVGCWLVLTVLGMAFSKKATQALTQEYSVPNHQSSQTNTAITDEFGGGGDSAPLVAVTTVPPGTAMASAAVQSQLTAATSAIQRAVPGSRIASFATTHDLGFVSRDGRTTFIVDYPPPEAGQYGQSPQAEKAVQTALHGLTIAGAPLTLTGYDALQAQAGKSRGTSLFLETVIGGVGALIVLAFVFASFLAVVPIVIALASIMTSFLAVWGLASATSVSAIVEYLIALVGLGIAIDYTLLIVVRWREERAKGHANEQAIVRAMSTAGRSVVLSGAAVAVGLLCLIALPVPFLRSLGYGGMLIPVVSVAATLTLLPVILATVGPRLDWPHHRTDLHTSRAWTAWARMVVRRRWLVAAIALVVLGTLTAAATTLTLGPANGNPETLSRAGAAKTALDTLKTSGIGSGPLTPIEILAPSSDAAHLATNLSRLPGIQGATAPSDPSWRHGNSAIVDVFTHDNSAAALGGVRHLVDASDSKASVGGIDAQNRDFISAVYRSLPLMVTLMAIVIFLLLAWALRSLLLPLKAILLNLLSTTAAWGVLTLVWQDGHGSHLIWGIPATESIPSWLPVIVFAFLFGLSMDYEVFILTRMREEYDVTGSTDTAVVRAIGRTGRLITSAAFILFLGFLAMSSAPGTIIKIMATGFGAGILLDATIIRGMLVPAAVSLFGRWNWYAPRALPTRHSRKSRVRPSPGSVSMKSGVSVRLPSSSRADLAGTTTVATNERSASDTAES